MISQNTSWIFAVVEEDLGDIRVAMKKWKTISLTKSFFFQSLIGTWWGKKGVFFYVEVS